uniref:Pore-forming protein-like protein n=1 Tax=Steinernema carpocapsae TaxID=34508 RepID=F2XFM9_STECR|nr:pore-forming protein-like protein [Steinernema carpocapsae]ADZ30830.1 saposin-like protein type B [Steinernema carpocapsae]
MKFLFAFILIAGFVVVSESKLLCNICQDLVGALENEAESNEGSIVDRANNECDKLTHDNMLLDPICKAIIDAGIDKVEDDIKNKEPASKICKKLHAC